jgi:hypothetical protein
MLEFITGSLVYTMAKDAIGAVLHKRQKLTPSEVLERRQKWKPLFEAEIWRTHRDKLRQDAIVRDMKRMDHYPDAKDTRGISPWFRVGLVGTYHRGIYLGLQWDTLTKDGDDIQWRRTDYAAGESGDIRVVLLGSVPYEYVDNVDWKGDEYYSYPHIYCYFNHKKQPYEHLAYYTETVPPGGLPFFTEVVAFDKVRKLKKKWHG